MPVPFASTYAVAGEMKEMWDCSLLLDFKGTQSCFQVTWTTYNTVKTKAHYKAALQRRSRTNAHNTSYLHVRAACMGEKEKPNSIIYGSRECGWSSGLGKKGSILM